MHKLTKPQRDLLVWMLTRRADASIADMTNAEKGLGRERRYVVDTVDSLTPQYLEIVPRADGQVFHRFTEAGRSLAMNIKAERDEAAAGKKRSK